MRSLGNAARDTRGRGSFVLFNLDPEEMAGSREFWSDEKAWRVLATVVSNLGVTLGRNHAVFKEAAWSPYMDNLDPYDANAFHNW